MKIKVKSRFSGVINFFKKIFGIVNYRIYLLIIKIFKKAEKTNIKEDRNILTRIFFRKYGINENLQYQDVKKIIKSYSFLNVKNKRFSNIFLEKFKEQYKVSNFLLILNIVARNFQITQFHITQLRTQKSMLNYSIQRNEKLKRNFSFYFRIFMIRLFGGLVQSMILLSIFLIIFLFNESQDIILFFNLLRYINSFLFSFKRIYPYRSSSIRSLEASSDLFPILLHYSYIDLFNRCGVEFRTPETIRCCEFIFLDFMLAVPFADFKSQSTLTNNKNYSRISREWIGIDQIVNKFSQNKTNYTSVRDVKLEVDNYVTDSTNFSQYTKNIPVMTEENCLNDFYVLANLYIQKHVGDVFNQTDLPKPKRNFVFVDIAVSRYLVKLLKDLDIGNNLFSRVNNCKEIIDLVDSIYSDMTQWYHYSPRKIVLTNYYKDKYFEKRREIISSISTKLKKILIFWLSENKNFVGHIEESIDFKTFYSCVEKMCDVQIKPTIETIDENSILLTSLTLQSMLRKQAEEINSEVKNFFIKTFVEYNEANKVEQVFSLKELNYLPQWQKKNTYIFSFFSIYISY